jgi:transcription initiation factor TFIID subunit TAF12
LLVRLTNSLINLCSSSFPNGIIISRAPFLFTDERSKRGSKAEILSPLPQQQQQQRRQQRQRQQRQRQQWLKAAAATATAAAADLLSDSTPLSKLVSVVVVGVRQQNLQT